MKGYTHERASRDLLDRLDEVRRIVDTLPNRDPVTKIWYSCHAVARVVATQVPSLKVVDGCVRSIQFRHSWLIHEKHPGWIIDAYPYAQVSGPVLLDAERFSPWHGVYIRASFGDMYLAEIEAQTASLLHAGTVTAF